jgi:hypothetical protein
VLHLAATTFDAVRELLREFRPALVPQVRTLALGVGTYDGSCVGSIVLMLRATQAK